MNSLSELLKLRKLLEVESNAHTTKLSDITFDNEEAEITFTRYNNSIECDVGSFSFYEYLFVLCDDLATCLEDYVEFDHLDTIVQLQRKYLEIMNNESLSKSISSLTQGLANSLSYSGKIYRYTFGWLEFDYDAEVEFFLKVDDGNYSQLEIINILEQDLLSETLFSKSEAGRFIENRYLSDLDILQQQYKDYIGQE